MQHRNDAPQALSLTSSASDSDQESEPIPSPLRSPSTPLGCASPADVDGGFLPLQLRDRRRYEHLGEHGRGGLGRVSRSRDRELGRDVAIKEMLRGGIASEARFLREVLITARLEHPGIVPMYEAGRWPDGTPYYAMKLVSGQSLREMIAARPTVEQRIGLLHHVIAVADAIAYAHDRGVIHRDLKPANVIVGDFGETIVIDWGLAKDLTSSDASLPAPGASPVGANGDVTVTGTVLGTPSYMAPEQERGESVDQRADVFAIGAMLWELCALEKVPPTDLRLRHRMLRRSGIDHDLAVIIDKALDPDPSRRYPDAGALARDLKAFKSGARIAAREYSLLAMLAHWIRRRRALALSVGAIIAVAIAGAALSLHNIAIERDRATRSVDQLTLKHAENLLASDPSAALDVLANYHGSDSVRADQIRAEAVGRGTAFVRAMPHTDNITWTAADPDGAILSLSTDGTIARTYFDGRSVVLTRDVSKIAQWSYSRARYLLAYTCDPADLCLFDFVRDARTPLAPLLDGTRPTGAAFSPDGTGLAVISQDGALTLLDVTDPARPAVQRVEALHAPLNVKFVDAGTVVTGNMAGLEFVRVDGGSEQLAMPDVRLSDTSASEHQVAVRYTDGRAALIESFPARVVARAELCSGPIADMEFLPGQLGVAYACAKGTVGVWNPRTATVRPYGQLEGHADVVLASPSGDYLVAAGGSSTIMVIDLITELLAFYKGHEFRLLSLTPPSPEHPFVISGDVRGGVRAWSLPPRIARVVATANSSFLTAIFHRESTTVTATSWESALTVFSPSHGARTLAPHERLNSSIVRSRSGRTFATYGSEDLVEVWSAATMTRTRIMAAGHGSISQLAFLGDTEDFVTAGKDGRLLRWTPDGQHTLVATLDRAIDRIAWLPGIDTIVSATADGALWRTDVTGQTRPLRAGSARVRRMVVAPDQQRIYAGYANGDVVAVDVASWHQETLLRAAGAVHEIATTADGRTIAVATNDGLIHVGNRRADASPADAISWSTLQARARGVALAPDGLLVAACIDGKIWLYLVRQRRWLFLSAGIVDLGHVSVNAPGSAAVAPDRDGRLLWIDLEAARKLLDNRP